jgi:cation transport protein ChaC
MQDKPILTRESLLNGEIERLVHDKQNSIERMTDDQRATLVDQTLSALSHSELWVFGYGSLIWNPAINYEEKRRCSIQGFEKKFCFWTTLSRGTVEFPGLMMGLVPGGSCNGVAFRIDAKNAETELDVLFRREMPHYIYKPTWIEAQCVETKKPFKTLTFVVDRENQRFVDNLSLENTVRTIATAQGPLGKNCDYLFQLSTKMHDLGFEEPELEDLVCKVKEFQASGHE